LRRDEMYTARDAIAALVAYHRRNGLEDSQIKQPAGHSIEEVTGRAWPRFRCMEGGKVKWVVQFVSDDGDAVIRFRNGEEDRVNINAAMEDRDPLDQGD
jgi:hypothetical protein